MTDRAVRRLCRAIIGQALKDRDYKWIINSRLSKLICGELCVRAARIVNDYKRYYESKLNID